MQLSLRTKIPFGIVSKGLTYLLLAGVVFFAGQFITQFATTQPYSMRTEAISDLGITKCGTYPEYITKQTFKLCSPLHLVMDATFVMYGALIMLGVSLGLRFVWPVAKFRKVGLALLFFGGIEAVVAGFSPLDLAPVLHRISGGFAIGALDLGLVLLGTGIRKTRFGVFTLVTGALGIFGFLMDGKTSAGLGYGGWERVAGYAAAVWFIAAGFYLRRLTVKR